MCTVWLDRCLRFAGSHEDPTNCATDLDSSPFWLRKKAEQESQGQRPLRQAISQGAKREVLLRGPQKGKNKGNKGMWFGK